MTRWTDVFLPLCMFEAVVGCCPSLRCRSYVSAARCFWACYLPTRPGALLPRADCNDPRLGRIITFRQPWSGGELLMSGSLVFLRTCPCPLTDFALSWGPRRAVRELRGRLATKFPDTWGTVFILLIIDVLCGAGITGQVRRTYCAMGSSAHRAASLGRRPQSPTQP